MAVTEIAEFRITKDNGRVPNGTYRIKLRQDQYDAVRGSNYVLGTFKTSDGAYACIEEDTQSHGATGIKITRQ